MNSTKLSAFCDRVIEVGCLVAVVTSLFLNPYSNRGAGPDKVTILRTIALLMAVAWMVKFIEERASSNGSMGFTWRTPLVLPTLLMVAVYLISTVLSVTPWTSLLGSYTWLQGTFTTFSYIVVFLMILQGMRTRAQLDRLVTIIIVSSLPVALYGLIQYHGLDPVLWDAAPTTRVGATMGNPIFLAAYLIMIFPLTLGRVVEGFRAALTNEQAGSRANILCAGGYMFIAAVQLMTTWYTQSRGPLLALVVGCYFLFLLLALAWRGKWGAISIIAIITVVTLVVGFIVLVSVPGGPLQSLQSASWLGRMGQIFSFARILYWQGMADLILPHEPLQYPDGHSDPLNSIRPLVGHGPESICVVYTRFRPSLLWHYEPLVLERAHNETFDVLATTGLLGLFAYLFLFLSVFYYGFKWLGLLEAKRHRMQLLGLVLLCSLVGIAFSWRQVGLHFFGVALSIGIVAGISVYLTTAALVFAIQVLTSGKSTLPSLHPHQFLIISLLVAIVAHFVEINFGIAVSATRTMFWACAGLLVVAGLNLVRAQPATQSTKRPRRVRRQKRDDPSRPLPERALSGWLWPTLGNAIMGGLILGTLAFNFIINLEGASNAGRVVWHALTTLPSQEGRTSYGVLMIVILTWLAAGVIFLSEMAKRGTFRGRTSDWLPAGLLYLTISLGLGLALALLLAGHQVVPLVESQSIAREFLLADRIASQVTLYYGFVVFALVTGSLILLKEHPVPKTKTTAWGVVALIPLLVLTGCLSVQCNLTPVQADIFYKQGASHESEEEWDMAIAYYERAIELAPREDWYYLRLGNAYLQKASSIGDSTQQDRLLQMAERNFIQAREINPLEIDHSICLADLYRQWYDLASDPAQKERLARQASANYEIATTSSPSHAVLWNTKGNFYSQLGQLEEAAKAYEHVVELFPRSHEIWHTLASIYAQLGRHEEAIAASQEALKLAPEAEDAWDAHRTLATLYSQLGQPEDALSHAQMAWQLAPDEEKLVLRDLIVQLQQAMEEP